MLKGLWDFVKTVALAGFLAFFCIRGFIFEPFRIPSGSMMPTLLVGDFLFVSKYSYGNRLPLTDWFFWQKDPERGDIAVFKNSRSDLPGSFFGFGDPMFIKRIIGMPGDRVEYRNKQLFINGEAQELRPIGEYTYTDGGDNERVTQHVIETLGDVKHDTLLEYAVPGLDVREMVVPKDMFVVVGDNRDNSKDSRFWSYPNWGFVPREDLMGRAEFIFLSLDKGFKPRVERMFDTLRTTHEGEK